MKNMHDMELLEVCTKGNYEFLRVPGGWVVTNCRRESSCFVPFNESSTNFTSMLNKDYEYRDKAVLDDEPKQLLTE